MFGYVTPDIGELKVKEHRLYQAIYCGLCRSMGKRVCRESKLTLSYDIVFLVLVRLALTGEKVTVSDGRCGLSPLKKRKIMDRNDTLDDCAAVGALLSYYRVLDKIADAHGLKKLGTYCLLPAASRMKKKAGKDALSEVMKEKLSRLAAWEKTNPISPEEGAVCFGQLLGTCFADNLSKDNARIGYEIGYHVGKWIYFADAVDDYESDRRQGVFNPFQSTPDAVSLSCSMRLELNAAAKAAELIDFSDQGMAAIIRNILYLGLPKKTDDILAPYRNNASR